MNLGDLAIFLLLQIVATLNAILSFQFISNRFMAAMVAGFGFVALGLYGAHRTWRWMDKWHSPTFYLFNVHLWIISLPMVFTRIFAVDFAQAKIWGIPATEFHRLSEKLFAALMIATVFDIGRLMIRRHLAKKWQAKI